MKKIFSIMMTAALVAFSMTSCKDKNEPEQGGDTPEQPTAAVTFEINVTDITSTGATIAVKGTPADAYYYWSVVEAKYLTVYPADTIAALLIASDIEQGATYDILVQYGYIVKGEDSYTYTDLSSETEYAVIAFPVDTTLAITGPAATKNFTTAKFEVSGEEALNLTDAQYAWAYYAEDEVGLIQIMAVDAAKDSLVFSTALYTGTAADGTYTEEDMYEPYAAYGWNNYYNYLYNEDLDLEFKTLSLTAAVQADSTLKFSGNVVADNGIKYTFDATAAKYVASPEEEEEGGEEEAAPAKKALRKAVAMKSVKNLGVKKIARK